MKSKTLVFIVLTIAVCAAAVVMLIREQDQTQDPQKLFPDFAADTVGVINQLNELRFEQGEQTLSIQKSDEGIWQVVEKDYFPADVIMIRNVLRSLSEAEKIEEMSSRPEDFPKLGIADPDAEEGAGILVEISDTDRSWQLIAGNTAPHLDQGQYIRLTDENRNWMINRRLELDIEIDKWLDKYIINIVPEDLHRIVIEQHKVEAVSTMTEAVSTTTETVSVMTEAVSTTTETMTIMTETVSTMTLVRNVKGGDFKLEDLPENREMKGDYLIQQIAAAVDYLQFKEVFPKDDSFLLPQKHINATFTTFDGLEFNMQSYQLDEESYATVSIGFNDDVASQYTSTTETRVAIQSDNEYLSQLYANWYYKLLSPTYDSLDMGLDDLTTEK